jgi:hypothetical protein
MKARQFPPVEIGPEGPGGGKYLPDFGKVLPADRKCQILEKFKDKALQPTGEYVNLGTTNKGPKWTIAPHEQIEVIPGCLE